MEANPRARAASVCRRIGELGRGADCGPASAGAATTEPPQNSARPAALPTAPRHRSRRDAKRVERESGRGTRSPRKGADDFVIDAFRVKQKRPTGGAPAEKEASPFPPIIAPESGQEAAGTTSAAPSSAPAGEQGFAVQGRGGQDEVVDLCRDL